MQKHCSLGLVLGFISISTLLGENTASAVVSYSSGTGFASGYTNTSSVIGLPSRVTSGPFGGPVDPFNSPYLPTQLLSVGTGGSVTLQLTEPFHDNPDHPFGLDFSIFGNAFFMITNGDYSGGGITDGTIFPETPSVTRVSVSGDGEAFFELTPSLAPSLVTYYPTDGSGRFDQAVNPALTAVDFAGRDIAGIRNLYGGSAGGTGYDLAWARNASGESVRVGDINFVRIDVLAGHAEIGGISAVPEPSILSMLGLVGMMALARINQTRSRTR